MSLNIHFTWGATDLLADAHDARIVPLLEGSGKTRVSCLHLPPGADTGERLAERSCALLVIHGKVTVWKRHETVIAAGSPYVVQAGVGHIVKVGEYYRVCTTLGAILLTVDCEQLQATKEGVSHPHRIAGQRWPGPLLGAADSNGGSFDERRERTDGS